MTAERVRPVGARTRLPWKADPTGQPPEQFYEGEFYESRDGAEFAAWPIPTEEARSLMSAIEDERRRRNLSDDELREATSAIPMDTAMMEIVRRNFLTMLER